MQILQLDLQNVKSHTQSNITFTPGTNAICGHNGAGKSSILEAIGFALFDALDVTQADFVREGEKTATVTVHVAGDDGRVYHVVRRCGGSSQYYVYDPELDQRLTESKGETMDWLRDFLGVEPGDDVTALFRDAVGVPQGLLTAAFLETPSRRKDTFNPLLRVDEYEQAWAALREPRSELNGQIAEAEQRIAGLEGEVKALPALREKEAALRDEIERGTARQQEAQAELDDVLAHKSVLETIRADLDRLAQAVLAAESEVKAADARLDEARAAADRAAEAQAVIEETADGHAAYLAAQDALAELETAREARDAVRQQRQDRETAQAVAQQSAETLAGELDEIAEAEARMAALAPQVEAQAQVEHALEAARREAQQLEAATEALARERARLAELKNRKIEVEARLEARATTDEALHKAEASLAVLNQQREDLVAQVTAQQAAIKAARDRQAQTTRHLRETEQALKRERAQLAELHERLAGVERDLATLAEVEAEMATRRDELAALEAEHTALTARLATDRAERARLQTRSEVLAQAETATCPVCEAELSPEHRAALLASDEERLAELAEALDKAEARYAEIETARREHAKALQTLERRVKALPRAADEDALRDQIAAQETAVAERVEAVNAAQESAAAETTRLAALQETLDALDPQLAETTQSRDAQQETVRQLAERLQTLPRPEEAKSLARDIAEQVQLVDEGERAVAALASAPEAVEQRAAELEALGNPRREYERAADIAGRRAAVEAELEAAQVRLAELAEQIAALEAQLTDHVGLDDRIAAQRESQAAHAEAHRRYEQHVREAASLAERREAADRLAASLAEATQQRDDAREQRDAVAAGYDAEAYDALAARHGELRESLAALAAELRQARKQREAVAGEIAALEDVQAELVAAREARDELAELLSLLEHLRQVLRDAGPEVTRRLVALISLHADRLFSDIMQSSAHLRWTEDYDIVLEREGQARGFQQLSGGEQMAAALAVRLALLRELSTINVAFFDEPTANLDRERRTNLARQILSIRGFSQLFVISHDDTFEQDTDHIVRVEKVGGVSQVEFAGRVEKVDGVSRVEVA